jgi:hypothetical protein
LEVIFAKKKNKFEDIEVENTAGRFVEITINR